MISYRMFAVLLIVLLAVPLVAVAQDATATPAEGQTGEMLNCDSTLALLLAIASRDYGYTGTGAEGFEFGQYSNYWMSGMAGDMGTGTGDTGAGADATEDAAAGDMSAEATEEAAAGDTGSTGSTGMSTVTLNPPVITGEDPRCTEIRTGLEDFFSSEIRMSGMSSMTDGASG